LTRRGRHRRVRLRPLRRDRYPKRRDQDGNHQDSAAVAGRHGERPAFDCHDGCALYTTSPDEMAREELSRGPAVPLFGVDTVNCSCFFT
jgi:hypothetical protein